MLQDLIRVASDTDLPEETEVVIIGGGIVGTSAALWLAEQGIPVCLFEKAQIACEQSGRNWGWVRKMGRAAAEIDLSVMAETLWQGLEARTGEATGYRQNGALYPCDSHKQLAAHARWKREVGDPAGTGSVILDRAGVKRLLPGCERPFVGGIYTPTDGCAEPFMAAPAIALGARKQGARIYTDCAVREVETTGGAITAVQTAKGRLRCRAVILAAGAWSSPFLRGLGLRLPQLRLRGSVARTAPVDGPDLCVSARDVSFRKRLDGGYTIARRSLNRTEVSPDHLRYFLDFLPTLRKNHDLISISGNPVDFFRALAEERSTRRAEARVLGGPAMPRMLDYARARLDAAMPALRGVQITDSWSGYIEGTPDALPVIGPVASHPGLILATGFSGGGFGPGPAIGQIVAELAAGRAPSLAIGAFSFHRFSAGARRETTDEHAGQDYPDSARGA
ncbi:NAD(P)/FAD-dependent oxidoreductase [Pseudooceanicola algae]|uniref:4-methylaminobutanoate oxidase (Formaldehyde-forming) n=1 Tax=Pseudooceanicola algae TaxID=1537215 RepID=A0A418SL31_9RHOB|nr:FAD-binding oxidoreductase [Pseudooceanicola algae]QPM90876.1 4-methylaminobutanoate oxidase (formaldehyde-forming) [Pseudooceanicola algae]